MNGPDHYREAEKLLALLPDTERGSSDEPGIIAEAQVHATLAVAAALGTLDAYSAGAGSSPGCLACGSISGHSLGRRGEDARSWLEAVGLPVDGAVEGGAPC